MRISSILNVLVIILILIGINVLGRYWRVQIDLTEDKRHSLSSSTISLVEQIESPLLFTVLLDGEFPAGFKRLRESTRNLLLKFNSINPLLEYQFQNPSSGSVEQINQTRSELAKDGILPTSLRYQEGDEMTNKQIYPYVIIQLGNRKLVVSLLEDQQTGVSDEVILNHSVSLLEYKFSDAIQKLLVEEKPVILFTSGNGELIPQQTASLENILRSYYRFGRVDPDTIYGISPEVDLVIVAKPRFPFSDRDKFILDQYVMRGGKIIWLIDKLDVNLDSINNNSYYIPPPMDLNLDDLFFSYGIRFQNDLVLDLECTRIPQVIGMHGDQPQIEMVPWPYHPLVLQQSDHPIVKNIDRVNLKFPGSIDTVRSDTDLEKTAILTTSRYTRFQMTPVRLSFEILKYGFDPEQFNKDPKTVGILVEGQFESTYQNRLADSMLDMLNHIGLEYEDLSIPTKQIFISDGDLIKNLFDAESDRISPLGYNKWEKTIYRGNESFIIHAIEYMMDEKGVLQTRSKETKLRLLDQVKASQEKLKWRLINIVLPVFILILSGIIYNYLRQRKYAR